MSHKQKGKFAKIGNLDKKLVLSKKFLNLPTSKKCENIVQGGLGKLTGPLNWILPPLSELKCSEFKFVCNSMHPSKILLTI